MSAGDNYIQTTLGDKKASHYVEQPFSSNSAHKISQNMSL